MNYWLMKSEPSVYGIDDLKREQKSHWEGVRNYQARNFMRDEMNIEDLVLFYHSNAQPSGVAGIAKVCSSPYPDFTALDATSKYFFASSTKKNPIWFMVDVEFITKFDQIVSLKEIRNISECADMLLLQKGQRLSILPLEERHYRIIASMGMKSIIANV